MEALLKVDCVSKSFGGIRAVDNLSFDLAKGEILGVIGPNGAGKTTVFNLLTGVYKPDQGSILLNGELLRGLYPDIIVRMGIARTFQNIRLFKNLTCVQNVMTPLYQKADYGFVSALLRFPSVIRKERELREKAYSLLEEMGLRDLAYAKAGQLPYGLQRKLEIARALATGPELLLLDEPAAGMNPEEARELNGVIKAIHSRFNLSIILIEHHMDVIMNICPRILAINFGGFLAMGSPNEIKRNEAVLDAYLGKEYSRAVGH